MWYSVMNKTNEDSLPDNQTHVAINVYGCSNRSSPSLEAGLSSAQGSSMGRGWAVYYVSINCIVSLINKHTRSYFTNV